MKVTEKEYEIYVDGILRNTCKSKKEFDLYMTDLKKSLVMEGYTKSSYESGNHHDIYINNKKQKATYISWRMWFGFRDANGDRIFDTDRLINKHGEWVEITEPYYSVGEGEYEYNIYGDSIMGVTHIKIQNMNIIEMEGIKIVKE